MPSWSLTLFSLSPSSWMVMSTTCHPSAEAVSRMMKSIPPSSSGGRGNVHDFVKPGAGKSIKSHAAEKPCFGKNSIRALDPDSALVTDPVVNFAVTSGPAAGGTTGVGAGTTAGAGAGGTTGDGDGVEGAPLPQNGKMRLRKGIAQKKSNKKALLGRRTPTKPARRRHSDGSPWWLTQARSNNKCFVEYSIFVRGTEGFLFVEQTFLGRERR